MRDNNNVMQYYYTIAREIILKKERKKNTYKSTLSQHSIKPALTSIIARIHTYI